MEVLPVTNIRYSTIPEGKCLDISSNFCFHKKENFEKIYD